MAEAPVAADETDAVLAAARSLAPEFRARATEGEQLRTLPPDLVTRAKEAGLFRLALPRSLGGLELDPVSIVRIIEELCRADGSAGWTVMIGNSTAFFAWLDPLVALALIGDEPDFVSTGVFAPAGQAVPDGQGGFVITGRWPFNSGCVHAEWYQTGVLVMDGDTPRMRAEGLPDWRFVFFRREGAEILDTWQAAGLKGTGSHDLQIAGLRVPEAQLAAPFFEPARHDGPLWRLPFYSLVATLMVGFPLGVARRALDEFIELAKRKARRGSTSTIAHDRNAQVELGRAEAGWQAARAFVFDAISDLWRSACQGDVPRLNQRARFLLAAQQAMRAGVAAVDTAFNLAGSSALYETEPLQRCFRDIHAADQHIFYSADTFSRYAKTRLGIEQPTFML
jgi:alkylation response protein AidB-like acyl-CoA dehydrogenase